MKRQSLLTVSVTVPEKQILKVSVSGGGLFEIIIILNGIKICVRVGCF